MSSTAVSMLPQDTVSGYVDVGVDLAKNVFQVAYIDPSSRRLVNRQLTRARFYDFVCNPDGFRKRIAVEACGASHYWCREAMAHGHLALMIPASATRTFVQSNKSDMNDARAIWQLMHCPGIPTVRIRSEDNQMLGCLLKYREKLISEKTKLANWIRAQLYELGKITKLGSGSVLPLADGVVKQAQDEGKKWAGIAAMMNASWHEIMASFDENIKSVDEFIASRAKASRLCAKLMTVPSIGLVSATVLEYVMEDPSFYRNGRQFSAYSGFAPRHAGTGGKIAVLGVDSQGNHLLKRVLYEAAMSALHADEDAADCKDAGGAQAQVCVAVGGADGGAEAGEEGGVRNRQPAVPHRLGRGLAGRRAVRRQQDHARQALRAGSRRRQAQP